MTDEYREQLLNYITNNVVETSQTENPFREDFIQYQNNLDTYILDQIDEQLGTYAEFYVTDYLQIEGNSNYLIYGDYWTNLHTRVLHGFFVILDENLNPVQMLLKYDTGTQFRQWDALNIDEEGQLYGVDCLRTWDSGGETYTDARRFILLNNVLNSNLLDGIYKTTLRNSYNLQYNNIDVYQIYKKIGSADYMMVGLNNDNSYKICVITLKVNVGEANVWNRYNSNYTHYGALKSFLTWTDSVTRLKIVTTQISASKAKYLEIIFNGSSFSQNLTYNVREVGATAYENVIYNIIIKDDDEVYYQVGYKDCVCKTNYSTSSYDTLYYTANENSIGMAFDLTKDTVFISHNYGEYDEQYNRHSYVKFGVIIGNNLYFSDTFEASGSSGYLFNAALFIAKNSFNLNELCLQANDYLVMLPVDYNVLNYNGNEYHSYNMLKSNKVTLYNNNRLIFSRNLYNKTITRNSTTSVGQVPHAMLNNIEINKEKLISETNTEMVLNNTSITKNRFETVYFNFTNTINVIDEDTNKSYPLVASYINTNINNGTQTTYENTTMGKIRINYDDNTNLIVNIIWKKINKYNKYTKILVYAEKVITSVDFISNDETTVYLTKYLETTQGNYYQIEQKVRTGKKAIFYPLNYNNEEVQYLTNPVYVMTDR